MTLTAAAKNAMLNELGTLITHIGLANLTDELASGGAYARQAITWGAASLGQMAMTGTEEFDIDAGSTVNRVILRDSATIDAGTDYGFATLTQEVFGGAGSYTLTALTITLSDS